MKTEINPVDNAYICMAIACVRIHELKAHIKMKLSSQCPLSLAKCLNIIKTAKTELPHATYKQLEADVLSAIREEEVEA